MVFSYSESYQVPTLQLKFLKLLIEKLYGISEQNSQWKPLDSYDDKNFRIQCAKKDFVLKITNCRDTNIEHFIEFQTNLMQHLTEKGLVCPKPVFDLSKNICSTQLLEYNSKMDPEKGLHKIRLLEFIPGATLQSTSLESRHFVQVGRLLAEMHHSAKDFKHEYLQTGRSPMWSLLNVNLVKKSINELGNAIKENLVLSTLDKFQSKLENLNKMNAGIIHGDFNEMNILVRENNVIGFLDLGDCHYGPYIFDLGITITYMMLLDSTKLDPLDIGIFVVQGYCQVWKISQAESTLLRLTVMARLSQSLVYGYSTWKKNPVPENQYVLATQKNGWPMLEMLTDLTDQYITDLWMSKNDI